MGVRRDEFAHAGERPGPMVMLMLMTMGMVVFVVMITLRRTGHAPIMPVAGGVCDC
jgi:hypothetical protein